MKNLTARVVSLFLVISLSASVLSLSGCKKVAPAIKTVPTINSTIKQENSIDLKGRAIRILSFYPAGKVEDMYKGAQETLSQLQLKRIKEIQSKYNCTFEYVAYEWQDNKATNEIMSGESPADIYGLNETFLYDNRDGNNILIPLDKYSDVLDLNNSSLWNIALNKKLSLGKVTQMVAPLNYFNYADSDFMLFNLSLLRQTGLWDKYNLYDMQKNKTWNWDVFEKLCRAVTNDTDHDGKIDRRGLYMSFITLNSFAVSNGKTGQSSAVMQQDQNGILKIALAQRTQKAALDMLYSLSKLGCITVKNNEDNELVDMDNYASGKYLFTTCDSGRISYIQEKTKDQFGVLAIPYGPDSSKQYRLAKFSAFGMGILRGAKDPETLCLLIKELSKPTIPYEEEVSLNTEAMAASGVSKEACATITMLSDPSLDRDYTINVSSLDYIGDVFDLFNKKITEKELFDKTIPQRQQFLDSFWVQVMNNLTALKIEYDT